MAIGAKNQNVIQHISYQESNDSHYGPPLCRNS